jgi:hypothetical protein
MIYSMVRTLFSDEQAAEMNRWREKSTRGAEAPLFHGDA